MGIDDAVDDEVPRVDAGPGDASTTTDARADANPPVVADGGTDGSPDSGPAADYAVQATVTGLAAGTGDAGLDDAGAGGLVLQNGDDRVTVFEDGTVTFPTRLTAGSTYAVSIASQPSNPIHTCTVSGGAGTVVSGDVATITVSCDVASFTVGGHVTGLAGSGLRLRLGDQIAEISSTGEYAFGATLASGSAYAVTVDADPTNPWQTCTVDNATGVITSANVSNVDVTCETRRFAIRGTVTGLSAEGLQLTNTVGGVSETLAVAANAGSFAFETLVPSGSGYTVTASAEPPGWRCIVANGAGVVAAADIVDVAVSCVQSVYEFEATSAVQTFVVPAGVQLLLATLEGAQGGVKQHADTNYGGLVTGTLKVTPGETLVVGTQPVGEEGGFNGGGAGDNQGRGGGGASDIRRGGGGLSQRVLVAGGGGGGGFWSELNIYGGKGGGLEGGLGYRDSVDPGGRGGTLEASGTGTCVSFDNPTVSGGLGLGGTTVGKGCGCEGYGGGGGFYGGSASGNCRGGGGGSGYAAAIGVSNVAQTLGGAGPGHGHVRLELE